MVKTCARVGCWRTDGFRSVVMMLAFSPAGQVFYAVNGYNFLCSL